MDTHSIDTDDLKQGLLYDTQTNVMDNNEYIKHFLLLVMQAVAMFVVSTYFSCSIFKAYFPSCNNKNAMSTDILCGHLENIW